MYCKDCKHVMKHSEDYPYVEESYTHWRCAKFHGINYITGDKIYALCVDTRLILCNGEQFERKQ